MVSEILVLPGKPHKCLIVDKQVVLPLKIKTRNQKLIQLLNNDRADYGIIVYGTPRVEYFIRKPRRRKPYTVSRAILEYPDKIYVKTPRAIRRRLLEAFENSIIRLNNRKSLPRVVKTLAYTYIYSRLSWRRPRLVPFIKNIYYIGNNTIEHYRPPYSSLDEKKPVEYIISYPTTLVLLS